MQKLSAREIQEGLLRAGYIDTFSRPLNAVGIYSWLYANGVSGPEYEGACGRPQGEALNYAIANKLAILDGNTGVNARPLPPAVEGTQYGSGIEGTQAPAAPPAVPDTGTYLGEPEPDPTKSFINWVDTTRFRLPGDEIVMWHYAKKHGLDLAFIEGFFAVPEGSITIAAIERGLTAA